MIISLHFDNCMGRSVYACDLPIRRVAGEEPGRARGAEKSIGRVLHFNLIRKVQVFEGVETRKDYPGKTSKSRCRSIGDISFEVEKCQQPTAYR
jgi:hypothetical protein